MLIKIYSKKYFLRALCNAYLQKKLQKRYRENHIKQIKTHIFDFFVLTEFILMSSNICKTIVNYSRLYCSSKLIFLNLLFFFLTSEKILKYILIKYAFNCS